MSEMLEKVSKAIQELVNERDNAGDMCTHEEAARVAIEAMKSFMNSPDRLAQTLHEIEDYRGIKREPNSVFRSFWIAAFNEALRED